MYAYQDVGADTIDQYLPMMAYETDFLKQCLTGEYDLGYGLGKFTGGYLFKYLNPVNLPLLLLGENHLPAALMISLYLKYVGICFFALCFFFRLLKSEKAAVICALLWTFSGYAVLWGQHYQFLTAILAFTVAVCGFQLFLDDDEKKYLVIPAMAYLAMVSYYYLYMSCFFFLAYGIIYLRTRGYETIRILKKAGKFFLCMIPAVLMAGATLIPAISDFLNSSRVEQVAAGVGDVSVIYPLNVLMAMLARLFSNDLFGVGDLFYGPVNYYECAILSVSILFVFAFVYLLLSKYWKRTLGVGLLCVAALCIPAFSKLIVFSTEAQRWTYLLCFAQVITIGVAMDDIFARWKERDFKKVLLRSVAVTDIVLVAVAMLLVWYHGYTGGWILNQQACGLVVAIVVMYHVGLALAFRSKRGYAILLTMVAVELVTTNYAAVNQRDTVSVEQWEEDMYYDGTADVVRWIQAQDDSVYRVAKSYWSVHYCDSLIQNYNGVGIYSSVNSAELIELAESYGFGGASHRIRFDGTDVLSNSMLGVKYIIAKSEESLNPDFYEKIYDDGTHAVYENRYWLGFGWWYDQQVSMEELEDTTVMEKALLLSQACGTDEMDLSLDTAAAEQTVDLIPLLTAAEQCQVQEQSDRLTLTGTGAGMTLYFDVPELEDRWLVSGVRVELSAQTGSSMYLLVATEDRDFSWDHSDVTGFTSGSGTYYLDNTDLSKATGIQLEVSLVSQDITIESLELILVDADALTQALSDRQSVSIANLIQDGNAFRATVTNPYEERAVLCLPLVYSDKWTATVDGEPAQVLSVNGGLTAIEMEPGEHQMRLVYQDMVYTWPLIVSAVCIVLFLLLYSADRRKVRKI